MVVTGLILLLFLNFSHAQISIIGSNGKNYTKKGQRFGINCTVAATLDTSITMLKGSEQMCSLLMDSCPVLPSERFPCGCSIGALGKKILYYMTDNATVQGFDDVWTCKEFNSSKLAVSLDVTVFSGPDNIRLNSSSQVQVSSGDPANSVQCSADCNPPCSYTWYKGVQTNTPPVANGRRVLPAEIILKQIPGSQLYTCEAVSPNSIKQTIVLEVMVKPSLNPVAPRKNVFLRVKEADVSLSNSSVTRAPLPNTPRLTMIPTIAAKPDNITVALTRPTTTRKTTTTPTTTTMPTTTTTTTTLPPITTSPSSSESDTETLNTVVVVGTIVGVVIGLIVIIVVAVIVVIIIYKRGQRQAQISRTISYAPGNPIYANDPDPEGAKPNLQGTILVRNDGYMNYSQGAGDQYGVNSPTYENTTEASTYSSLDKIQLKEQPSNTYEPLECSSSVVPQNTLLANQQSHGSSDTQSDRGIPGSPVYMNTLLGNDKSPDLTKMDANDVPEEPMSLEYMNFNVAKKT